VQPRRGRQAQLSIPGLREQLSVVLLPQLIRVRVRVRVRVRARARARVRVSASRSTTEPRASLLKCIWP